MFLVFWPEECTKKFRVFLLASYIVLANTDPVTVHLYCGPIPATTLPPFPDFNFDGIPKVEIEQAKMREIIQSLHDDAIEVKSLSKRCIVIITGRMVPPPKAGEDVFEIAKAIISKGSRQNSILYT